MQKEQSTFKGRSPKKVEPKPRGMSFDDFVMEMSPTPDLPPPSMISGPRTFRGIPVPFTNIDEKDPPATIKDPVVNVREKLDSLMSDDSEDQFDESGRRVALNVPTGLDKPTGRFVAPRTSKPSTREGAVNYDEMTPEQQREENVRRMARAAQEMTDTQVSLDELKEMNAPMAEIRNAEREVDRAEQVYSQHVKIREQSLPQRAKLMDVFTRLKE